MSRCARLALFLLAVVTWIAPSAASAIEPPPPLHLAWEKNFLKITGPALPGGTLEINYLEAYCRAGSTDRDWGQTTIPHRTELVEAAPDGRRLVLRSTLADGVTVEHVITCTHDEVAFALVAHNPTKETSAADWAQPCITVAAFTGRDQQTYLSKCFVFLDGKLTRLPTEPWATEARYTPGQVYCPRDVPRTDVNPRPLSKLVPSSGLVGCFSADEKWIMASAWEPYQELFQGVRTCIHSDFRIGGLRPGETKHIRGKIYLVPSDAEALVARYARDFPQQVRLEPQLIGVKKIWDRAAHNAFTGLTQFKDTWFCVFREGTAHVAGDGSIRVLRSSGGDNWESNAHLTSKRGDLRDPKICITAKGELMIVSALALPKGEVKHQSVAFFSTDGTKWSEPTDFGEPNIWIWRVVWHNDRAYGIGYSTVGKPFCRLYESQDGRDFKTLVATLNDQGQPNEAGLVFQPDGTAVCLLRRDSEKNASGLIGTAKPPFTDWTWREAGPRIGGPDLIRTHDGRLIAGVRLYDGGACTGLCEVDLNQGKLVELLRLPSGGDTSYPGLVEHDGQIWASYYSSHEGKTSIYFAKVKL